MKIKKTIKTPSKKTQKFKKNLENLFPLKYLSNFWRRLDMHLINYEVSLTLTWSESVFWLILQRKEQEQIKEIIQQEKKINAPTNATFKTTDTTWYVPVVNLSTKDDNNLLEQLQSRFKRTIKRNKYRSEMTNQTKTNHLNHLIDPAFIKVNDYLFYRLKMKKIEHLFQSIMYQKLK